MESDDVLRCTRGDAAGSFVAFLYNCTCVFSSLSSHGPCLSDVHNGSTVNGAIIISKTNKIDLCGSAFVVE